ncbi:MAG: type II toxin-antitoxin system VapC family toxin [Candidatus Scalindua sp.]|nr:type II toxin-antitoxin system VapC family toxin [Candidatus Scalindua sp.]
MPATEYLIDTNILIYHTKGSEKSIIFMDSIISQKAFNISVITKIEFLGWDKHTPDGIEKCKRLLEYANTYLVDEGIANKAIELKRRTNIKLADAIIAATAVLNNLNLKTRNVNDFKAIEVLEFTNPFD